MRLGTADLGARRSSGTTPPAWHARPSADALLELAADAEHGLARAEALRRLAEAGPNRIAAPPRVTWVRVLARQFADTLVAILAVAALLSLAVGEALDALAIALILVLNAVLGFVQEWRAEGALAALQGMLTPRCRVLRDGDEEELAAEELVPGDVVLLEAGDRVPADLRILEARELAALESSLTGESDAVPKRTAPVSADRALAERSSMLWMGTLVTSGVGRGVVVATGGSTELGRIAELTRAVEPRPTPLQVRLARLGRQLGLFALVGAAAVAGAGLLLGRPALDALLTAVSLAVAVVPEGLPAVVTITLALGVRQMVRRRALPRRLQAVETLGSASVVLTDKTGTLTAGEMTLVRAWLAAGAVEVEGSGYTPVGRFLAEGEPLEPRARPDLLALLASGLACNHARLRRTAAGWVPLGEPTEAALVVAAAKAGLERGTASVGELPFDARRKRMSVLAPDDGGVVAHVKGAPESVLPLCTRALVGAEERELGAAERARATAAYRELAAAGLRTLAVARGRPPGAGAPAAEIERELTLLGFVGILDPPRPEVQAAVARARAAGIRVTMVTGDAPETARAVAERVGLAVERVITGPELDRLPDAEVLAALERPVQFARAAPEHKLRLARLLEGRGEVVAMTGDGVNDAPALKEADIGIAMGLRGTDVAREAADLVLTDDNFDSIVGAIEEGRRQYENIQKFVRYLLSSNIGETVAIVVSVLLVGPLILLPVQILWINVVTDSLTAIALGLEPAEGDLMRRRPRRRAAPLLDRGAVASVLALGGAIGVATLLLFLSHLDPSAPARARTLAFTGLALLEQANLLNHRALRMPLARLGFWTNPWLLGALTLTGALQVLAVYLPPLQEALHTTALGLGDWLLLLVVAAPVFLVPEAVKLARWRRRGAEA